MNPTLLTVEEAREGIGRMLPPPAALPSEDVPVVAAAGRVAAVDLVVRGDVRVPGGGRVGPWDLAALVADGQEHVRCVRRPRVAVVANGDELVDFRDEPGPGQVADVAGPALAAALGSVGAEAVVVARARDQAEDLRRAMRAAAEADIVVSVAGVSVGDHDLVRGVIEELGHLDFWRVAMRPGKPLAVGSVLGRPFIGLPGNPVSALVGFEVFVLPAVMALGGRPGWGRPLVVAELAADLAKPEGLRTFTRVRLESRPDAPPLAHPVAGQASFQLRWLANSDALLDLPAAGDSLARGSAVAALLINRPPVEPPAVPTTP